MKLEFELLIPAWKRQATADINDTETQLKITGKRVKEFLQTLMGNYTLQRTGKYKCNLCVKNAKHLAETQLLLHALTHREDCLFCAKPMGQHLTKNDKIFCASVLQMLICNSSALDNSK